MKRIAVFLALFQIAFLAGPAFAQQGAQAYGSNRTVATESWIEEWDPASGSWVKVADIETAASGQQANLPTVTTSFVNGELVSETRAAMRYAQPAASPASQTMIARYGPFVVTSATSAAMMGPTDTASPAQFDAMLRDFPQLALLEMVEAPGTSNDIANLAVGRRIREAGIATHVPAGGSVRSGAVELFLAGATRTMEQGAQFAVHSWLDSHGREADDFTADHPAHRLYIDYYLEMGMSEDRARGFYAMTNSVPHSQALWLGAADLHLWLRPDSQAVLVSADPFVAAERQRPTVRTAPAIIAAMQPRLPTAEINWGLVENSAMVPVIDYGDLSKTYLARLDVSQLDSGYALP